MLAQIVRKAIGSGIVVSRFGGGRNQIFTHIFIVLMMAGTIGNLTEIQECITTTKHLVGYH